MPRHAFSGAGATRGFVRAFLAVARTVGFPVHPQEMPTNLGPLWSPPPPARCSTVQTRRPPREVNSPADGPAKGSNLNVTLLKQIIAQGPEGNAVPLFRSVALSIPAKKQGSGDVASMIIAGLMTPPMCPGLMARTCPTQVVKFARAKAE